MIKTCGVCGVKSEGDTTENVTYRYKGLESTVPNVTGHHCPHCGEVAMDYVEGGRYMAHTNIFRHVVDIITGGD
jgi:YgiT-type zinc finger domain-containing protein